MMAPSIFARCSAEQLVNRLCQREEVVALIPHAAALLRMLFRSSNVPAKVSQRSLLRKRARGVLVRILKVRPHETQRRRGRPCAAPQRTVWSERQCGQRRLCASFRGPAAAANGASSAGGGACCSERSSSARSS